MTEKVKVPKGVADAIEKFRNADFGDYGIVNAMETVIFGLENERMAIRSWVYKDDGANADRLLDALRIGYEVEPEYKVGEYVISHDGYVGLIEDYDEGHYTGKWYGDNGRTFGMDCPYDKFKRHATSEEIQALKERQVWKSIGRGVNEWKHDDVVIVNGSSRRINSHPMVGNIAAAKADYLDGQISGFYPAESFVSFEDGDSNA